jgi:hypothetical protein
LSAARPVRGSFLLKAIIIAVSTFLLLGWGLGLSPESYLAATIVIVSVILLGFAIVASACRSQFGAFWWGPAVPWALVRLQKALQPGQNLFFRFSRRTPPRLRIRSSQLLLTCTCEETFIQICFDPDLQDLPACRIVMAADGPLFWSLSDKGRSDLTLMVLGVERVPVGDEAFDSAVRVVGPAPLALAVLRHGHRRELLDILRHDWSPVTLQCDPPAVQLSPRSPVASFATDATAYAQLRRTLTALAGLLRRLAITEADIVPALAANATADVCGPVRRRNLEVLLAHAPGTPAAAAALAAARQDPDPSVRAWLAMREGGRAPVEDEKDEG